MNLSSIFPSRGVFLKIFISFWLTMALTIAVITLMARVSSTETFPERASRGPWREGITLYSETLARIYEREGKAALDDFIRRSLNESGTETFWFDADGKLIAGGNPDVNVANVVRGLQDHPQEQPPKPFSLFSSISRSSFGRIVTSPSGSRYIFVIRFRTPGGPPPFFTYSRIAVSILIAGLLCYLLGLYLVSPLKKLQSTVKEFAEGNFDVRVPPELLKRRDELADVEHAVAFEHRQIVHRSTVRLSCDHRASNCFWPNSTSQDSPAGLSLLLSSRSAITASPRCTAGRARIAAYQRCRFGQAAMSWPCHL